MLKTRNWSGRLLAALLLLATAFAARPETGSASAGTVLVVGLGDSVTAGYGASPGNDYFTVVSGRLRASNPRTSATNLAVSGSTSEGLERVQLPRVPRAGGAVKAIVLITTGGNDLIHPYGRAAPRECAMYGATFAQAAPWVKSFSARLERILSGLQQRCTGGLEVYVADIYDPTDGVGDIENAPVPLPPWKDGKKLLDAYNAVICRVASRHPFVHVVGIRERFQGHGIHHGARAYWYYTNLEDPNDDGYAAIADAFSEALCLKLPRR